MAQRTQFEDGQFQATFSPVLKGYTVNYISRTVKLGNDYEMDDAIQDSYAVFLDCKRRYEDKVDNPRWFFALFKTALFTHFADNAKLRGKKFHHEISTGITIGNDDESQTEIEAGEEGHGELAVLLREAEPDVLKVLQVLLTSPQEELHELFQSLRGPITDDRYAKALEKKVGVAAGTVVKLKQHLEGKISREKEVRPMAENKTIISEILGITGVPPQDKKTETDQEFFKRCLIAVRALSEEKWELLGEKTQGWYNDGADAVQNKRDIAHPSDEPALEAAKGENKPAAEPELVARTQKVTPINTQSSPNGTTAPVQEKKEAAPKPTPAPKEPKGPTASDAAREVIVLNRYAKKADIWALIDGKIDVKRSSFDTIYYEATKIVDMLVAAGAFTPEFMAKLNPPASDGADATA